MKVTSIKSFAAALVLLATGSGAFAGHEITVDDKSKDKVVTTEFPYTAGTFELELGAGAFGSIGTKGTDIRPDVGYAIGVIRGGVMLNTASGSGFFRGNFEVLGEVFGGGIFSGPGDYLVGLNVFLRYNFVQPDAKIVPFFQIGGGGVYSDAANDDPIQRNIGSDLSFVLESELGLRFHISRNLAITGGVEYRHISNASTSARNQGLNSLGGLIGVSMFF